MVHLKHFGNPGRAKLVPKGFSIRHRKPAPPDPARQRDRRHSGATNARMTWAWRGNVTRSGGALDASLRVSAIVAPVDASQTWGDHALIATTSSPSDQTVDAREAIAGIRARLRSGT